MQCQHLFYSPEMASVAKSVTALKSDINIVQFASFDHWLDTYQKPFPFNKSFEETEWDPILVLHSSGSTGRATPRILLITYFNRNLLAGTPKPITLPNGFFAATDAAMRPIPGRAMGGTAAFSFPGGGSYFSPFPPFHLAGANALIYQPLLALEASVIIGLPDRPPTPQFILDILEYKKPEALYSPPSLIEMISQMPGGFDALKACKSVIYAGGPLSKACGDQLAAHVRLGTVCKPYALFPFYDLLPCYALG